MGLFLIKDLIKKLPRKISLIFAYIFALFIFQLNKLTPYRKFLFNNIKETLQCSDEEAKRIEKAFLLKFSKNIVDFCKFSGERKKLSEKYFVVEGEQYFLEALAENKGVILISAHYGCWELLGNLITQNFANKLALIVQKPSEESIDLFFTKLRKQAEIETFYNNSYNSLKKMLKILENNGCIGMLIDQHGESEDVSGTFFGKTVSLPSGAAYFSAKTGAVIVPVFIRRISGEKHKITFFPFLSTKRGNKVKEISKISQELYLIIEKVIKENPDEWLWFYERFNKIKPEEKKIV